MFPFKPKRLEDAIDRIKTGGYTELNTAMEFIRRHWEGQSVQSMAAEQKKFDELVACLHNYIEVLHEAFYECDRARKSIRKSGSDVTHGPNAIKLVEKAIKDSNQSLKIIGELAEFMGYEKKKLP